MLLIVYNLKTTTKGTILMLFSCCLCYRIEIFTAIHVCWIDATQRVQEDMLYCILKTQVLRIDFSQLSFGKKQLLASVSKEKLWTGDFNDIFLLDGGISFFLVCIHNRVFVSLIKLSGCYCNHHCNLIWVIQFSFFTVKQGGEWKYYFTIKTEIFVHAFKWLFSPKLRDCITWVAMY